MNKVIIEMEAPESIWVRGNCAVDADDGTMRYEAKFLRSGGAPKPQHMGPVLTLIVKDSNGKELSRRSATVGIRSNGDMFFHYYKEAQSELEKADVPPLSAAAPRGPTQSTAKK